MILKLVQIGFILALLLSTTCAQESSNVPPDSLDAVGVSVVLSDWSLGFTLPQKWSPTRKLEQGAITAYLYTRETIVDTLGRDVNSGITVAFEKINPDLDPVEYSANCRFRVGVKWKIDRVFSHEGQRIKLKSAIGYHVRYRDKMDNEHTSYVIHAKRNDVGVQIITDITTELYPLVKEDWDRFLKSIDFVDSP